MGEPAEAVVPGVPRRPAPEPKPVAVAKPKRVRAPRAPKPKAKRTYKRRKPQGDAFMDNVAKLSALAKLVKKLS